MKTFMDTLRTHLRGYNIPRNVAHRVCEVLNCFRYAQVDEAYNAVPYAKELLDKIANQFQESLTLKQQVAVRKAYLVLKYPDKRVRKEFLSKDLDAIASVEPSTVNNGMHVMRRGLHTINGWDNRCVGTSPSIITIATRALASNSSADKPFTIERLARKVQTCVEAWRSLPDSLRKGRRWESVFGHPNYALMLDGFGVNLKPDSPVGNIGVTFEQGMKPRLFASPMLHYQAYLEPLKTHLQRIARMIPEDFHGDQQAGRKDVQSKLQNGVTCHCYDLSSATHLFPWTLQLKMLRMMGIPQDLVNMVNYCSKGYWTVGISGVSPIKWNSGQPLGLGPSFFVFSLCHHAIIRGIFDRLGEDYNGGYALLGDDVVIYNSRVAKVYTKVMEQIGCKINLSKSIISDRVAEFAGATITSADIINIGKFRKIGFHNGLDYNLRWDTPTKFYEPIVSYLREVQDTTEVVSNSLSVLRREYVSQFVATNANKIINHVGVWSPSHAVRKLNRFYEQKSIPIKFDSEAFDQEMRKVAGALVAIFNDCSECFPNAVAPHLISPAMIVLIGVQELVQAAIEDTQTGYSIPLWYDRFASIIGGNVESGFSVPRLLREANRFISVALISTLCTKRAVTNRYVRQIRKALKQFDRLLQEDPSGSAVEAHIYSMSRFSGSPLGDSVLIDRVSAKMLAG